MNHHTSEGGLRVGETPRYLVVYKYGSAVFFNMGRREREECLKLVRSFAQAPLAVPCPDDYRGMVRPGVHPWARTEADHGGVERPGPNQRGGSRPGAGPAGSARGRRSSGPRHLAQGCRPGSRPSE